MKPEHDIASLAKSVSRLAGRAVLDYQPVVEGILGDRSRDTSRIERTLDGLLDFAFDSRVLLLFKRLSRHYYFIDPGAAAEYVRLYRELWDAEPREDRQKADH